MHYAFAFGVAFHNAFCIPWHVGFGVGDSCRVVNEVVLDCHFCKNVALLHHSSLWRCYCYYGVSDGIQWLQQGEEVIDGILAWNMLNQRLRGRFGLLSIPCRFDWKCHFGWNWPNGLEGHPLGDAHCTHCALYYVCGVALRYYLCTWLWVYYGDCLVHLITYRPFLRLWGCLAFHDILTLSCWWIGYIRHRDAVVAIWGSIARTWSWRDKMVVLAVLIVSSISCILRRFSSFANGETLLLHCIHIVPLWLCMIDMDIGYQGA